MPFIIRTCKTYFLKIVPKIKFKFKLLFASLKTAVHVFLYPSHPQKQFNLLNVHSLRHKVFQM